MNKHISLTPTLAYSVNHARLFMKTSDSRWSHGLVKHQQVVLSSHDLCTQDSVWSVGHDTYPSVRLFKSKD